jgi:hypothetical protein
VVDWRAGAERVTLPPMPRLLPVLLLAGATSTSFAPFQCTSEPDPAAALEETPGEALYRVAQELDDKGERKAWQMTLEHLIARYPSSRFAATARQDLADAGIEPPPP